MIHCFVINPAAGKKLDTNNLTEKIEEAAFRLLSVRQPNSILEIGRAHV